MKFWPTLTCLFHAEDLKYLELRTRQRQVGSLAGAAHLLKNNTGVLRSAQLEQKSHVEQKGKSWLDFDFQYKYKLGNKGLSILSIWVIKKRGVRKVTTGITGLWQPSVHSDIAFWSFNVGSSYHCVFCNTMIGLFTRKQGTWAGFRPSWDRLVLPYWWIGIGTVIYLSTRGTGRSVIWICNCLESHVATLTPVHLWLNASKLEIMLEPIPPNKQRQLYRK